MCEFNCRACLRKSYIGDFWYGMSGLCLEQAQPFHPYELSGSVHLYGCLLTMGRCSFALFLECHISQIHVKLFLWWPCITPIIFLMQLCLNVPWHLKRAILLVAHPYMYAREMQYLVAWFLKTILLYLGLTFIVSRLYFSLSNDVIVCWTFLITCGVPMFFVLTCLLCFFY
jgi:hypothetical protein